MLGAMAPFGGRVGVHQQASKFTLVRADPAIGTLRYLQWAALSSQPLTTSPSSMHLSGRLGQALVLCLPGVLAALHKLSKLVAAQIAEVLPC